MDMIHFKLMFIIFIKYEISCDCFIGLHYKDSIFSNYYCTITGKLSCILLPSVALIAAQC